MRKNADKKPEGGLKGEVTYTCHKERPQEEKNGIFFKHKMEIELVTSRTQQANQTTQPPALNLLKKIIII